MRNQYENVEEEANSIMDRRRDMTNQQQQWNYNKEVGKNLQAEPFKYQAFEMSSKVDFTDDMRKLIYDEKAFPNDIKLFNSSDWQLAPVTETHLNPPDNIPSLGYIRAKKVNPNTLDNYFGEIEHEGKLKGKANEINYNTYFYNLRSNALICYTNDTIEAGQKCLFFILLNETTYDYKSDTGEYLFLKGQNKNLKILRDEMSRELIKKLQRKLLLYSFRGAYTLRNEVPSAKVSHYIYEEIDTVGPIEFNKESAIKEITNMKYYRETIGGFFKLLQMNSLKRNNKAGTICYPRWLKQEFRDMILMQTWLSTNVIPPQHPLMSLKIKVNSNEKQGLFHSLKYIFPYRKQYLKRSLIIYESELIDAEMFKALNNLSFPMFMYGFPNNSLSVESLHYAIKKSSDFCVQIIDLSYNLKLTTIAGAKAINLLNSNPSVKKLILKGCGISSQDPDVFFQALSSNIALEQLVIDYNDAYNQSMVDYLQEFQGIIEDS